MEIILKALQDAGLYCNLEKTHPFETEIDFLGHYISEKGIEANGKKIECIVDWPWPQSTIQVRQFCGLVWYISAFLSNIAEYTYVLNELMMKECNVLFPEWTG